MKNFNVSSIDIDQITEQQAAAVALDKMEIKGHQVYFVNFGKYFGYSVCVFKNAHHIRYADDYALHHSGKTQEELKGIYIDRLNARLFTESEILAPLKDYDDYRRRMNFLHNDYAEQVDRVSIFGNFSDEKFAAEYEEKIKGMYYNAVGLCYTNSEEFNKHHAELWLALMDEEKKMKDNFDYYKSAFLYEMYNHEYGINWQADWDTLSAFGKIEWHEDDVEKYFDELDFTKTQRKAYAAARAEYFKGQRKSA